MSWRRFSSRWSTSDWVWMVVVSLLFFVAAKAGLLLATMGHSASPIWPATGVGIGALLLRGPKFWPAIFVAAFASKYHHSGHVGVALLIACGSSLEALSGSWVYRKARLLRARFEYQTETLSTIMASAIGSVPSALIGTSALVFFEGVATNQFLEIFLTWWVGDCVGGILIQPLFMRQRTPRHRRRRLDFRIASELLAVFVLGGALSWAVFSSAVPAEGLFLIFPVLLLSQIRLSTRPTRFLLLLISGVAVVYTVLRGGPFSSSVLNDGLLHLQLFVAMAAISVSVLAGFDKVDSLRVAWPVLFFGWSVSALVFSSSYEAAQAQDTLHFDQLVHEAELSIKGRMKTYEHGLLAGVGLFASSTFVTNDEWRSFVETLKISENYPGVNGIGLILPVKRGEEAKLASEAVKKRGLPSLPIHDVSDSSEDARLDDRFVITYIEPYTPNWQARGLDVASEANRRRAAELARDTGRPAMTDKIYLVQDRRKRPGFLVYYPFYRTKTPPTTTEERRATFAGWIYAPFVTEKVLSALPNLREDEVHFLLFDSPNAGDHNLVYTSAPYIEGEFKALRTTKIDILQNEFYVQWAKAPHFRSARGAFLSWIVSTGLLVTLLIASTIVGLYRINRRANQIAREKTGLFERARLEAEEAVRVKAEFLANMSHEIRTPMNGIIGMTNVLKNSSLDGEQKKVTDVILSSCDTLLSLVNDILDFSKLEAGKVPIESFDFSVLKVIQETVELLRSHAIAKNLELRFEIAPGSVTSIKTDATRYRQILTNLVSNAIKFTSRGRVVVSLSTEKRPEGGLIVHTAVADTGMGIPEAAKERLFQSFSQVDVSTTRRFGGTGLGLAISKGLAELLGGRIWVESIEGQGSTFHFTIVAEEAAIQVEAASASPVAVAESAVRLAAEIPLTILVADDNQVNQIVAKRFLEMLGYTVDIAANGVEVLVACKQKKYDLIFMDCHMPEMDGFEATRRLVALSKDRAERPRIVALTASAMAEDRRKCYEAGMDDFVMKPVSISELVRAIREGFRRSLPSDSPATVAEAPPLMAVAPPPTTLINAEQLMAAFLDDRELIAKVVDQFLADLPGMLAHVESAAMERDAGALEEAAHKVKGAMGNFHALVAIEAALALEMRGVERNFVGIESAVGEFKNLATQLASELKDFSSGSAGDAKKAV